MPSPSKDPHAELRPPPFLVPIAVGEIYIPPGHVANEKYWYLLMLASLNIKTELPLGL